MNLNAFRQINNIKIAFASAYSMHNDTIAIFQSI